MRVGIDVDEVVAQLHHAWIGEINAMLGYSLTLADFDTWEIQTKVEPIHADLIFKLLTPEMYARILPYPGSLEAVRKLRAHGHSIHWVTSSGPNNENALAKQGWLRRFGYMIEGESWESGHFVPGTDKSNAPVDVLVDDHLKNIETFRGWGILHNRPHNLKLRSKNQRVNSLWEVVGPLHAFESAAANATF